MLAELIVQGEKVVIPVASNQLFVVSALVGLTGAQPVPLNLLKIKVASLLPFSSESR